MNQWVHPPLRGQSQGSNHAPSQPYIPGSSPIQPEAPSRRTESPTPSRSCSLPQTGKPTHFPGTLSNHRPKKAKFRLTSNDAFLNFRPAVFQQTCSFPAKRRKGWRNILASALGILQLFRGRPLASAPSLHSHSQRHSPLPGTTCASSGGRPWQDPPSSGHGFSPCRLPPPRRRHASLRLTTASNSLKALGFFPLRSEASSSVAWGCLATPRASSEGPPKLDLTAQGISLYSCLNLNNLVLNNNTMVIACMGPKLHLNNVQELTQTNKGQKMHFGG